MRNYQNDGRCVMTLDAGGTNFVYSAIRGYKEIVDSVTMPAHPHNLELCLKSMLKGFNEVQDKLQEEPVAISFAFPGPADYKKGVIGNLPNMSAFKGGVPLKSFLENEFDLPVYINNDGALFALGEADFGFLPHVNGLLKQCNISQQFRNLIGLTIGTGLGGGLIVNGTLCKGDNSAGGEVWQASHKFDAKKCAEEGVSIRAVKKKYADLAGLFSAPSPKEIFEIGMGKRSGNQKAAKESYRLLGEITGNVIANAITLIDGLVVIGGGLAKAHALFFPALLKELNRNYRTSKGEPFDRLDVSVFNLQDEGHIEQFLERNYQQINVPGTDKTISYDPVKRIGIGVSRLGTNHAVAIGAYYTALDALDQKS